MVRQTERYTTCGTGSSLYAKPCAALNNRYVRSVCVSKEMIRAGGSPSEAAPPILPPERHTCRNVVRRERNQYT